MKKIFLSLALSCFVLAPLTVEADPRVFSLKRFKNIALNKDRSYASGQLQHAGDINQDGVDDLIGNYLWEDNNDGGLNRDKVRFFFGDSSLTEFKKQDAAMFEREGSYSWLSLGSMGDINNDGDEDVFISTWKNNELVTHLFYDAPNWNASPDNILANADATLRTSVSEASENPDVLATAIPLGDIDGNGIDDVAINYSVYDYETRNSSIVFHGSTSVLLGTNNQRSGEVVPNAVFPESVDVIGTLGDINDDGRDDFYIGRHRGSKYKAKYNYAVHYGRSSITDSSLRNSDFDLFLHEGTITGVGDVDDDGYDDFAITREGKKNVLLYFGGRRNKWGSTLRKKEANSRLQRFIPSNSPLNFEIGTLSVRPIGDFNTDGIDDMAIVSDVNIPYTVRRPAITEDAVFLLAGKERWKKNFNVQKKSARILRSNRFESGDTPLIAGPVGDYNDDNASDLLVGPTRRGWDFLHSDDRDNDGYTALRGDCRDRKRKIRPHANERRVNGRDDDCDGMRDENRVFRPEDNGPAIQAVRRRHHRVRIRYADGSKQWLRPRTPHRVSMSVDLTTDGTRVVIWNKKTIRVHDAYTGELIKKSPFPRTQKNGDGSTRMFITDVDRDGIDEIIGAVAGRGSGKKRQRISVYLAQIQTDDSVTLLDTAVVTKKTPMRFHNIENFFYSQKVWLSVQDAVVSLARNVSGSGTRDDFAHFRLLVEEDGSKTLKKI
jgi:hypothetical protein